MSLRLGVWSAMMSLRRSHPFLGTGVLDVMALLIELIE